MPNNELSEEMMGKGAGGTGPGQERTPSFVTVKCSKCGTANEIPALRRPGATFYCANCGKQLNNLPPPRIDLNNP